ncbi:COG2426 family protein [Ructibacterium gallinarum]|uniref:Small multi-drug export protein n=1 Tax=Ructibacterium gallinarum TaxID=2779355 RepID=A0A9D5LZ55_9FIRM|nr:small multi-drug export protein [Ructibacterium gallinarum]MBE5039171.1 small multi-drug export protein [Ructibacterium gallinarum]
MNASFTEYFWTFFLSMAPISEIRGSLIYALNQVDHTFGNILVMYLLSVIGNFLPVPVIMLIFRPIVKWLKTTRLLSRFAHWLEDRTRRKAGKLSKASAGALMIFVAIPFPTTGAWTGAMIASLLDMRFKYAFPAILLGIMISGIIMTLLVTGVLNLGVIGEWMTSQLLKPSYAKGWLL